MRKLLIVNAVVVILGTGCVVLENFFGYGACPIIIAPVITSFAIYVIMFLVFIGLPCLLIVDIVQAFRGWRSVRWRSLLPLVVLCTIIPAVLLPNFGLSLGEKRFMSHLPEYEAFVSEIKAKTWKEDLMVISNPATCRGLAYIIRAYENEPNVLVAEFWVAGMGPPPKHIAFLYTSSGNVSKGSDADKDWHRWKRMNENWFRVGD
ncbi:MAG: hypothetical protein ACYSUY_04735 [Planctomycetota bacterium]|jgi:hypothetical protein